MVYLKHDRFYKTKALTNNDTDTLDLQESGIVSGINLVFSALTAAGIQANNKARIIDHITTIEVTDGADGKMFSLTGQELKALNFFMTGKVPHEVAPLYGGFTQRTNVLIPFGAYLGDPNHALDLAAWDKVQVEITNDATTAMWAAAALNVDMQVITLADMAAKPAGYYKSYEWRNNKPAADGQHVYHDLPSKDLIRRYFVQVDPDLAATGDPTNDPAADANNLKLTFRQEQEVVWDHRPKDIMRANALIYGNAQTQARYFPSTTQYADLALAYVAGMSGSIGNFTSGDSFTTIPVIEDNNTRFTKWGSIGTAAGVTDSAFADILATGIGYYHCMMLYDAMSENEAMFLNPAPGAKGPVRLDLNPSKDDQTLRSCLQVPRKQGQV